VTQLDATFSDHNAENKAQDKIVDFYQKHHLINEFFNAFKLLADEAGIAVNKTIISRKMSNKPLLTKPFMTKIFLVSHITDSKQKYSILGGFMKHVTSACALGTKTTTNQNPPLPNQHPYPR
jgi:hypothetical protein